MKRRSAPKWSMLALAAALAIPVVAPSHGNHDTEATGNRSARHIAATTPEEAENQERRQAREKLAAAVQLTAAGRREDALEIYKEVANQYPPEGIPALARFINLTQNETEAKQLAERLINPENEFDSTIRARGLVMLDRRKEAVEILEASQAVHNGDEPEGALLLAQIYADAQMEQQREELLCEALLETSDNHHAAMLFDGLFSAPVPYLSDHATSMLMALDKGFENSGGEYPTIRDFMNRLAIEFQMMPNYFVRRDKVLDSAKEAGPAAAMFGTFVLIREEDHAAALEFLEPLARKHRQHPFWNILEQQRADLLRQVQRPAEANSVLRALAVSPANDDETLKLEAAMTATAASDLAGARKIFDLINVEKLPLDRRPQFWGAKLNVLAKQEEYELLMSTYAKAAENATNDHFEYYHDAVFKGLMETQQHWKLEELARARAAETPALWRLAAGAAREARKTPNEIEALYQYAKARPNDSEALVALADVIAPLAKELAQAPADALAVPEDEVQRVMELAEKAMRELVRSRPYDPAPYVGLMELFEAQGKPDEAQKVALEIGEKATNPRIIGNAAFVLATKNYPESAMKLYDRALKIDPNDMQIRMNRTACLTRLGKFDEAAAFYRELLINGHNGRGWHEHELIDRLWKIAVEEKKQDEAVDDLFNAVSQIKGPWRHKSMEDAGSMMLIEGRLEDANRFFDLLASEADMETRNRISERIAVAYFNNGELEKAEQVFAEALKRDLNIDHRIGFAQSRAELLVKLGRKDEAIAEYERVAREEATDQGALLGLFRAAMIAEEIGNTTKARDLYQRFLDSDSLEFAKRREAELKLNTIPSAVGN